MEIDFNNPLESDGLIQREISMQVQMPTGQFERVNLVVWVTGSDSLTAINDAAKTAGIALLERAIQALKNA